MLTIPATMVLLDGIPIRPPITMAMAAKIASKSTMTVATGKTAFYEQQNMELGSAYAYTSQIMVDNMLKLDAKEGISAFIEKRHPKWQDR